MSMSPGTPERDRETWRQVVCRAAQTLRDEYPVHTESIDEAEKLVLGEDLTWVADGSCLVTSQRDPAVTYTVRDQRCTCEAFRFTLHERCKHLWAVMVHHRAREMPPHVGSASQFSPSPEPETPRSYSPRMLPEAPASANVYIELAGRQIQLTLRDSEEDRLLRRLRRVLAQFPLPALQEALPFPQSHGAPVQTAASEDSCKLHGVTMRKHTKEGQTWFSHRTGEGWCRGKE